MLVCINNRRKSFNVLWWLDGIKSGGNRKKKYFSLKIKKILSTERMDFLNRPENDYCLFYSLIPIPAAPLAFCFFFIGSLLFLLTNFVSLFYKRIKIDNIKNKISTPWVDRYLCVRICRSVRFHSISTGSVRSIFVWLFILWADTNQDKRA